MSVDLNGALAEAIRGYYLDTVLSAERLEAIARNARATRARRRRSRIAVALAALVALLIAAAFLLYQSRQRNFVTQRIAAEVLFNFHKSHPGNLHVTAEYEELAEALPRLDFSLADLPCRIVESSDLVGGRYCSLQGALAAQLRLERRHDSRSGTLYVTRNSQFLRHIGDKGVRIGDFEIDLWSDEQRFFALIFELPHNDRRGNPYGAH